MAKLSDMTQLVRKRVSGETERELRGYLLLRERTIRELQLEIATLQGMVHSLVREQIAERSRIGSAIKAPGGAANRVDPPANASHYMVALGHDERVAKLNEGSSVRHWLDSFA